MATVYVHVKSSIMVEVLSNDHASEPNAKGKFTIRFSCAGVVYSKPLDVTYAINGTASSGTDYTPLTGTVRIPANTSSVSLEVVPQNNFLIEGNSREVTIEITGIAEGA